MTTNLIKTTAAVIAAAFVSAGAAFADDATLVDKINSEIDTTQAQTYELVTAKADERVSKLAVASNEADDTTASESFTGS